MKILLIKPSNNNCVFRLCQPLGIMYLAAYVRERFDVDIKLFDMRCYRKNLAYLKLKKLLKNFCPDIIGISALTIEKEAATKVAKLSKENIPDATIVMGGPYPSSAPDMALLDSNIDYIVMGEGEEIFVRLLKKIENNEKPYNLPGVGFRNQEEIIINKIKSDFIDITKLPFPAWDLINMESYFRKESMTTLGPRKYMTVMTTRGCPYKCEYCHNIFGKDFRTRDINNVIEELKILKEKYKITDIEFVDDCFNFKKERLCDFFHRIIKENLKLNISFPNGVRIDLLDEDAIRLMKWGGVNYVCFGLETASIRLQKEIKKNLDLDKAKKIIYLTNKYKIFSVGYFMLGFPGETKNEIESTIDFAVNSELCIAAFFVVIPYTKEMQYYYAQKERLRDNLSRANYSCSSINLSSLTDSQFKRLHKFAFIRFYFSPKRIYRIIKFAPNSSKIHIILYGIIHIIYLLIILR